MAKVGNIITTFDDVLVNTSYYTAEFLNSSQYSEYLNPEHILKEAVYSREEPDLIKFLLKDEYKKDIPFIAELDMFILYDLFKQHSLYDVAKPTPMFEVLFNNTFLTGIKDYKKIYIVDYEYNDKLKTIIDDKKAFVEKYNKESKDRVEWIILKPGESLADYIEANKIQFELVVSDDYVLLEDLCKNTNINLASKEYIVPAFKYNDKINPDASAAFSLRGGIINQYKNY